jgi:hypothetical protein
MFVALLLLSLSVLHAHCTGGYLEDCFRFTDSLLKHRSLKDVSAEMRRISWQHLLLILALEECKQIRISIRSFTDPDLDSILYGSGSREVRMADYKDKVSWVEEL